MNHLRKIKRFGLTGGIAAGKSTVAGFLSDKGWKIIDTDVIARDLCEIGKEGYKNVVDVFGVKILKQNRSIDRVALGKIVFKNSDKRKLLNSILHPLVRAKWIDQFARHEAEDHSGPAVVVIPLMFETGMNEWFDSIGCVACPLEIQITRLMDRGLSKEEAHLRIEAQWSVTEKMKQSDKVIWNIGSLELLKMQTEQLNSSWLSRA
ncbi:MAG: dephospho-CoA kinase [Verrucomicrobiota bacterium]